MISGPGATDVTHEFIVQRGGNYPRVMRLTNAGHLGVGDLADNYSPPATFHIIVDGTLGVNGGLGNLSVDEIGSKRYNPNVGDTPGILGGGACLGFNAIRQSDAAIRCEAGAYKVPGPNNSVTTVSRNGGAILWADGEGSLSFAALPSNGGATGDAGGAQFFYPNDVLNYRVLKIRPRAQGQVQIGPLAPQTGTHADYRLAVDGKLVAKSVFVTQATANWADFVFAPDYRLASLPELEAYLHQHRHLPAMPAAAEVAATGLDLGEANARLLQSLEELTLHVIELGKQNAQLQARLAALEAQLRPATPAIGK